MFAKGLREDTEFEEKSDMAEGIIRLIINSPWRITALAACASAFLILPSSFLLPSHRKKFRLGFISQMASGKSKSSSSNNSANVGFEAKLWLAADKLRSNMDAAEYKHVVLGLIFLKYISDSFEEHHAKLISGEGEYAGANPEDPDEYRAENIFWVPPAARWTYLQNSAKQPTIGKIVDDAMVAIERDNLRLKGILPKEYARPALDKNRLGELIDLIGTIGMGDKDSRSKDILGRVYEYFLGKFASADGKKGGQFYTPQSVVRLLVEML